MISFIFLIFLIIQSVKANDFLFGDSLPFVIPFWIILGIAFLILWILIVLSWIKYFRFVNKAKKNKTVSSNLSSIKVEGSINHGFAAKK